MHILASKKVRKITKCHRGKESGSDALANAETSLQSFVSIRNPEPWLLKQRRKDFVPQALVAEAPLPNLCNVRTFKGWHAQ